MFKKLASLTLAGLLIQAIVCVETASASSKAEKEVRHAENIKARVVKLGVSKEANIQVTLRDKTKLSGVISEVNEDSFVLTGSTAATTTIVAYNTVGQVGRRRRSGGWKYGLILAGVGLAVFIISVR